MKFKSLLEIPKGYKMQLTGELYGYPQGTVVVRGHKDAYCDDESAVAFTLPNGDYYYCEKHQITEIEEEKKMLKQEDVITVEMTALQAAVLNVILSNTHGDFLYSVYDIIGDKLADSFDPHYDKFDWVKCEDEDDLVEAVKSWWVAQEETEQQKRIRELKETIELAQKQINELENKA